MNQPIESLLGTQLPLPGLAAWCARWADRTVAHQCYSNWLTPAQVQQTVTRLALAAESLQQHKLQPVRLCWVFEHLRLHLAIRPDGACLALFAENRADLPANAFENVLDAFVRAPA